MGHQSARKQKARKWEKLQREIQGRKKGVSPGEEKKGPGRSPEGGITDGSDKTGF